MSCKTRDMYMYNAVVERRTELSTYSLREFVEFWNDAIARLKVIEKRVDASGLFVTVGHLDCRGTSSCRSESEGASNDTCGERRAVAASLAQRLAQERDARHQRHGRIAGECDTTSSTGPRRRVACGWDRKGFTV